MQNYGAEQPMRETQVTNQINIQKKSIAELSDVIDQLSTRLERALSPGHPSNKDETKEKSEPLAPLADELRVNSDTLNMLSNRLRYLISRIEI